MPISNTITFLPLNTITLRTEDRQRTTLDPQKFLELAQAILTNHWISPILVNEDGMLMAGGRRYSVVSALNAATNNDWSLFPEACREAAKQLDTTCPVKSWESWTKIPSQIGTKLTDLDLLTFEWSENWNREDLSWQDKAQAVFKISSLLYKTNENWTDAKTAAQLSMSASQLSQFLAPLRAVREAPEQLRPELEKLIELSESPISAKNAVASKMERHGIKPTARQGSGLFNLASFAAADRPEPAPTKQKPLPKPASLGDQLILCANFNEWAPIYTGEKFNFLHCDFPYGVSFNESAGNGTNPDTLSIGTYDDGEEVYWGLVETLLASRNTLLESTAHIMFWLSIGDSKMYGEPMIDLTKQRIREAWPDAKISGRYLIWHCSDNSGLLPAPQSEGRRTYEIALQITLGNRPLAKPKAISFSHPRNESRIHRSQKPLPVLSHFLPMYVDSSSRVLDPTCGSATSIITAHRLGAASVLGLELDEGMRNSAVEFFDREIKQ